MCNFTVRRCLRSRRVRVANRTCSGNSRVIPWSAAVVSVSLLPSGWSKNFFLSVVWLTRCILGHCTIHHAGFASNGSVFRLWVAVFHFIIFSTENNGKNRCRRGLSQLVYTVMLIIFVHELSFKRTAILWNTAHAPGQQSAGLVYRQRAPRFQACKWGHNFRFIFATIHIIIISENCQSHTSQESGTKMWQLDVNDLS